MTTQSSKVASTMGIDCPYVLGGLNWDKSWAKSSIWRNAIKSGFKPLKNSKRNHKNMQWSPLMIWTLGRLILHTKIKERQWLSIKNNKNLMLLQAGDNKLIINVKVKLR